MAVNPEICSIIADSLAPALREQKRGQGSETRFDCMSKSARRNHARRQGGTGQIHFETRSFDERPAMRKWFAWKLHQFAALIHDGEQKELIEVVDEWEICRCRVEVAGDEYGHGENAVFAELPEGWNWHAWKGEFQWH